MTELRSHGIKLSLDDFGTGYSSLSYLRRLPLNRLKIDRTFVRDIFADHSGGAIVQAILSLGSAMGLSVMAEGVETEEQREYLAALGCDLYQGYLFSPPVAINELEKFIRDGVKPGRRVGVTVGR
jgi:EAL domain-containing protein (putative c-di-GMP-specific phosphodiesterase class I)